MAPLCVIGAGRIGRMFADLARAQGHELRLLARGQAASGAAPILVCTRNDDLDAVLTQVPADRQPDLVFVQNGAVWPWLHAHGLEACTRGVLYVAVQRVGDPPVPGAASVFFGPHAATVVELMQGGGLSARVARDAVDMATQEGTKLAWICALGPLAGATGLTVGEVCTQHKGELAAICGEIAQVLALEPGVVLDPAELTRRVVDYTQSIPHFRSGLKEWRWRNGWLVAAARRHGVDMPVHDAWVEQAGGAPAAT